MDSLNYFILYPLYFDKSLSLSEGRKFNKESCIKQCTIKDITSILSKSNIEYTIEDKNHPKGSEKRIKIIGKRKEVLEILKKEISIKSENRPKLIPRRKFKKKNK